jgi:hypothetical protein
VSADFLLGFMAGVAFLYLAGTLVTLVLDWRRK